MAIVFTCQGCGEAWDPYETIGCPNHCDAPSSVPDEVWQLSRIADTSIYVSAHLLDEDRLRSITTRGIHRVLDVSNDPERRFTWRPPPATVRSTSLYFLESLGLVDSLTEPLSRAAMARAVVSAQSLTARGHPLLICCSVGVRRAPHVAYSILIARGWSPEEAWDAIHDSRPFVNKIDHYAEVAEDVGKSLFLSRA